MTYIPQAQRESVKKLLKKTGKPTSSTTLEGAKLKKFRDLSTKNPEEPYFMNLI